MPCGSPPSSDRARPREDGSRPPIETALEIVGAIRAQGRRAVVAGGAVRDCVLGRPVTDVDVATDMPLDELSSLFTTHEVGKSKQFDTVVVTRGGHAFEVTRFRGSPAAADPLLEDTAHRDFTINAMLLGEDGRVIDLQRGLDDLRAGVVRAVGVPGDRFAEDPLRILRGVRFAACLGFSIEPETAAAMRSGAAHLAAVAGERVGAEVLKMASQSGPALAAGVVLMEDFGLLGMILPEVRDLRGLEQPAEWHPEGDAWEHTLAALRASDRRDPAVNLAVLLHDVGKRPAHFVENGRHRYHGHEQAGLGLVDAAARRLFLPQRLRAAILFAVAHHGRGGRMDQMRRSKRIALIASEHWAVLRALVLSDIAARGVPAAVRRAEEVFREAERDAAGERAGRGAAAVISGDRIMELTGLSSGPRVGEIQRRVREWALDNRVEDRESIDAEVKRLAAATMPPLPAAGGERTG